jgi:hypothetical protein
MSKPSWFLVGEEALEAKKKEDALAQVRRSRVIPRFWLRESEEAVIIFVDDLGFFVKQHQVSINNSWAQYTCVKDYQVCPLCHARDNPMLKNLVKPSFVVSYFTVIDTRTIKYKDGTEVRNRKLLFPAKGEAIEMIFDLKKSLGSLVGISVRVKRYGGSRTVNCGNSFTIVSDKPIDFSKISQDAHIPFDYEKVLAPPTEEELKALGLYALPLGADTKISEQDTKVNPDISELLR